MEHLRPTDKLLDLGTGGGEFLLTLGHPYGNTAVTEPWPPNIKLCMEKLKPLGIAVFPVEDEGILPFENGQFDIAINRQATYDLSEVHRILKPGGMFITQQVGSQNCLSLQRRINLEEPVIQPFSLETELPKLKDNHFSVQYSDECFPELLFFDVGAIVFWAKIIEWSFPGFSVAHNFTKLCKLQDDLAQDGFIATDQHRFIIAAESIK